MILNALSFTFLALVVIVGLLALVTTSTAGEIAVLVTGFALCALAFARVTR